MCTCVRTQSHSHMHTQAPGGWPASPHLQIDPSHHFPLFRVHQGGLDPLNVTCLQTFMYHIFSWLIYVQPGISQEISTVPKHCGVCHQVCEWALSCHRRLAAPGHGVQLALLPVLGRPLAPMPPRFTPLPEGRANIFTCSQHFGLLYDCCWINHCRLIGEKIQRH